MIILNKELINILEEIKKEITDDSDLLWTSYKTPDELRVEIDSFIFRSHQKDITVLKDIYIHFLPTSTFQEHAIQNGWSKKYMLLSDKFDKIYDANTFLK